MLSIQDGPRITSMLDVEGLKAGLYRIHHIVLGKGLLYTTGYDIEWAVFDDGSNHPKMSRFLHGSNHPKMSKFSLGNKYGSGYTDRDNPFGVFFTRRENFFAELSSFEPESSEFILFNLDLFK